MKIHIYIPFLIALPSHLYGLAPECPLYANRKSCLASVEDNYKQFIDFIESEYEPGQEPLIQAASTIRQYEGEACLKTCVN